MHLERADVFQVKAVRRSAEIAGKLRHRVHVGSLRGRRQIADRHVLDHAPTKRAQLGHLIAPVLKIRFNSRNPSKQKINRNRPAKCRVSGFVQSGDTVEVDVVIYFRQEVICDAEDTFDRFA